MGKREVSCLVCFFFSISSQPLVASLRSRSFGMQVLPYGNAIGGEAEKGGNLLPVADLFNHKSKVDVSKVLKSASCSSSFFNPPPW